MTDAEMAAFAKAHGLEVAWRDHPADVKEAIASAAKLARAFTRPEAAAEPIPPYAVAKP
ncbi:MAG: hypothetical protein JWO26_1161 [Rhodospirillales bacterium]|nr:hypothetical protein [Rhodospirillales bacterium]MDB5381529.1 hypothetical protein [Rhodospirillales bacterium]